jgi:hypothetical protein
MGCVVTDTQLIRSYDYVVTRSSETRRVEVKGTQGLGDSVIVTTGEVTAARRGPDPTDLFIVYCIEPRRENGRIIASGINNRIRPTWTPEDKNLVPTKFRYVMP